MQDNDDTYNVLPITQRQGLSYYWSGPPNIEASAPIPRCRKPIPIWSRKFQVLVPRV